MSNTVREQVNAVINGKRKYVSNAVARVIASGWHGGQSSPLYSLASCGAITELDRVRAEITSNADYLAANWEEYASDGNPDDLYAELIALDAYVAGRVNRYRNPVKGWADLWV